ncbi:MAG: 3-aminobutyryl-CoA ammonia lyase [Alphaproteobacteria bacterium]|nr:3-aminobutyryl-CoA ammonia lyase [Alphaproteobacteria bacterium]
MSAAPDFSKWVATIETRLDSHYPDGVISLGVLMELFGIVGGKLSYMFDGDAGLARAYESVEFLSPAYQGDYVRATVKLLEVGRTSRKRLYEAHVVARQHGVGAAPSHGEMLAEPLLVARAVGTVIVPREHQRLTPAEFKRS